MTVRPLGTDGNSRALKSELPGSGAKRALLTLRAAVILSVGLLIGVATGFLTYFATRDPADAVLAGIPACAGAIKFLDTLVD
jgi:hypothetical protein